MSNVTKFTISEAQAYFGELVSEIDRAYWSSSAIQMKDQCFNALRIVQQELDDLGKISIQDHHYPYEVINAPLSVLYDALKQLESGAEKYLTHTKSKQSLLELLGKIHKGFG